MWQARAAAVPYVMKPWHRTFNYKSSSVGVNMAVRIYAHLWWQAYYYGTICIFFLSDHKCNFANTPCAGYLHILLVHGCLTWTHSRLGVWVQVCACASYRLMPVPADWLNLFSSPLYLSLCSKISRVERPLALKCTGRHFYLSSPPLSCFFFFPGPFPWTAAII